MNTKSHLDPELIQAAYDNWRKESKLAKSKKARTDLKEALTNYEDFTPTPEVKTQLNLERVSGHPCYEQLYRDRLVMDYLVVEKGYTISKACDLWSDWEDYSYDLIEYANK